MRIGLLIYDSLDQISGGYLYDRKLVEYLQNQGDEIHLLSLPRRKTLHHIRDNFSARLARQFIALPVDVLLQDELNHASVLLLNRKITAKRGFSIISIVHHLRCMEAGRPWEKALYRWMEKHYLTSVDGFIFNSHTTRRSVYQVAPETSRLPYIVAWPAWNHLRANIDEGDIHRRALCAESLKLVFVGNLIPRKGLHILLQALSLVKDEKWDLTIIGDAETDQRYAKAMIQKIHALSKQEQIHFLGRLDQSALEEQLLQAHVLVVPSTYEGFGIAYLEAMSFGLPPIATTSGGASEFITHGKDGFLVPPRNPEALAQTIARLARERTLLARLGSAARQTACHHPTWEESGEKIRRFLSHVSLGVH